MIKIKNIIISVVLCLIVACKANNTQVKAELTININNCGNSIGFINLAGIKISKNEIDFKTIIPKQENKFVIKNLEFGNYKLVYKVLFQKEKTVMVNITENKNYDLAVCVSPLESLSKKHSSIIENLLNSESYSFFYTSNGCFHSIEDTIIIKKSENTYSVSRSGNIKKLRLEEVEAIRQFEIELDTINQNFDCTTIDTYVVKYKKTEKYIRDGSCSWNGFDHLIEALFGKQNTID